MEDIGLVAAPAFGDGSHMAGLKPFIAIELGRELRVDHGILLPPGQQVPRHILVIGRQFGLKRQRMSVAFGGLRESQRHAVLGIAENPVRIDRGHQFGHSLRPRLAGIAGSLIPHVYRKQHLDAAPVKISDHLPDAGCAARHGEDHVQLIAVVDAQIGIGGPDDHRIDAAIALVEIVQIPGHGVFAACRIIEVAIFHHHQRLDKTRSRPFESGGGISRAVIADINSPLHPPVVERSQEAVVTIGVALRKTGKVLHRKTFGSVDHARQSAIARDIAAILKLIGCRRHRLGAGEQRSKTDPRHPAFQPGGSRRADMTGFIDRQTRHPFPHNGRQNRPPIPTFQPRASAASARMASAGTIFKSPS